MVAVLSLATFMSAVGYLTSSISEANMVVSALLWISHVTWLLLIRRNKSVTEVNTILRALPGIILMVDVAALAFANPEVHNFYGFWSTKLVCRTWTWPGPDYCWRNDFSVNLMLTISLLVWFGCSLLHFDQALWSVPMATVVYLCILGQGYSATSYALFTNIPEWEREGLLKPGQFAFFIIIVITLVLRYSRERCDRDFFLTLTAQKTAIEAHESFISASRRLCRSVFDIVFFVHKETLEFYDSAEADRLLLALSIGRPSHSKHHNTQLHSFTDFFLNTEEHTRFSNYLRLHASDNSTSEELPAQLMTVMLKDEAGSSVSTKVYCTQVKRFNQKGLLDKPDECFLVGLSLVSDDPQAVGQLDVNGDDSQATTNIVMPNGNTGVRLLNLSHLNYKKDGGCRKRGRHKSWGHRRERQEKWATSSHATLISIPEIDNMSETFSTSAKSAPAILQDKDGSAGLIECAPDEEEEEQQIQMQDTPETSVLASVMMLLGQWHLQHNACCPFHLALARLQTCVNQLKGACKPAWKPRAGWQCGICGILNNDTDTCCGLCKFGLPPALPALSPCSNQDNYDGFRTVASKIREGQGASPREEGQSSSSRVLEIGLGSRTEQRSLGPEESGEQRKRSICAL